MNVCINLGVCQRKKRLQGSMEGPLKFSGQFLNLSLVLEEGCFIVSMSSKHRGRKEASISWRLRAAHPRPKVKEKRGKSFLESKSSPSRPQVKERRAQKTSKELLSCLWGCGFFRARSYQLESVDVGVHWPENRQCCSQTVLEGH